MPRKDPNYLRNYYRTHRKRILQRQKAYRNRSEVKKSIKEWKHKYHLKHKEDILKKHKEYYDKHKKREQKKCRKYRFEHPKYKKEYSKTRR